MTWMLMSVFVFLCGAALSHIGNNDGITIMIGGASLFIVHAIRWDNK